MLCCRVMNIECLVCVLHKPENDPIWNNLHLYPVCSSASTAQTKFIFLPLCPPLHSSSNDTVATDVGICFFPMTSHWHQVGFRTPRASTFRDSSGSRLVGLFCPFSSLVKHTNFCFFRKQGRAPCLLDPGRRESTVCPSDANLE